MQTLVVTSPTNGQYTYTPTSDSDAKVVRGTLTALGCRVSTKGDE